jgi:hypothetical protein
VISGTAATVVAVLVNGHTILQTLITKPVQEGEEPPPQKSYALNVQTRDDAGGQGLELDLDGGRVFVEAWITASGPDASPADGGPITIQLTQGAEWVSLTEGPPIADGRSAIVQPRDQLPDGDPQLPVIVLVSAPLAGQSFSAPVTIQLTRGEYELIFE